MSRLIQTPRQIFRWRCIIRRSIGSICESAHFVFVAGGFYLFRRKDFMNVYDSKSAENSRNAIHACHSNRQEELQVPDSRLDCAVHPLCAPKL